MKFRPTNRLTSGATRFRAIRAFTLIEVLAALTFMAIVIPVAVEGMRIASLAGVVAERKAVAIRIAERVLAEYTTGSSLQGSALTGTIEEGVIKYRWQVETIPWPEDTMQELTVQVFFPAQGREYDVRLSTLEGLGS